MYPSTVAGDTSPDNVLVLAKMRGDPAVEETHRPTLSERAYKRLVLDPLAWWWRLMLRYMGAPRYDSVEP